MDGTVPLIPGLEDDLDLAFPFFFLAVERGGGPREARDAAPVQGEAECFEQRCPVSERIGGEDPGPGEVEGPFLRRCVAADFFYLKDTHHQEIGLLPGKTAIESIESLESVSP